MKFMRKDLELADLSWRDLFWLLRYVAFAMIVVLMWFAVWVTVICAVFVVVVKLVQWLF